MILTWLQVFGLLITGFSTITFIVGLLLVLKIFS